MARPQRWRTASPRLLPLIAGSLWTAAVIGGPVDLGGADAASPLAGCEQTEHEPGAPAPPAGTVCETDTARDRGADRQFLQKTIRNLGEGSETGRLDPAEAAGTPQPGNAPSPH